MLSPRVLPGPHSKGVHEIQAVGNSTELGVLGRVDGGGIGGAQQETGVPVTDRPAGGSHGSGAQERNSGLVATEGIDSLGALIVRIAVDLLLELETGLVAVLAVNPGPAPGRRRDVGRLVIARAGTESVNVAAQAGNIRETHARRAADEAQLAHNIVIQF